MGKRSRKGTGQIAKFSDLFARIKASAALPPEQCARVEREAYLALLDRISCHCPGWIDSEQAWSHEEQLVNRIDILMIENDNGGIDQYLFNSSGNGAHRIVADLEEIGADTEARVMARLIADFPGGVVPADRDQRIDLLMNLVNPDGERWHEESRIITRSGERIISLLLAYALNHPRGFREPPDDLVERLESYERIAAHYLERAKAEGLITEEVIAQREADLLAQMERLLSEANRETQLRLAAPRDILLAKAVQEILLQFRHRSITESLRYVRSHAQAGTLVVSVPESQLDAILGLLREQHPDIAFTLVDNGAVAT